MSSYLTSKINKRTYNCSRKLFIIFLFLSLFTSHFSHSFSKPVLDWESEIKKQNKDNFTFNISTEKDTFCEGEDVIILLNVKNENSYPDSLLFMDDDKFIKIKDENNNTLLFHGPVVTYAGKYFIHFIPNETKEFIHDAIFDDFGNIIINYNAFILRCYFKSGNYSITYEYYNYDTKEKINSNTINISIIKPEGKNDQAFMDLKTLSKITDSTGIDDKFQIDKIFKYLDMNQESVYYPQIFRKYLFIRAFDKIKYNYGVINEVENFLKIYNNTVIGALSSWYIMDISIKYGGGKSEAIEKMNELIQKYPNTRVSKKAEELLQSKELKN